MLPGREMVAEEYLNNTEIGGLEGIQKAKATFSYNYSNYVGKQPEKRTYL